MTTVPGKADAHHRPLRTCIGCRTVRPRHQLVRIVRGGDGSLRIGPTLSGRGAWLCPGSRECFEQAARRGGFARAFRTPVPATQIDALRVDLVEGCGGSATDFVPGTEPARD